MFSARCGLKVQLIKSSLLFGKNQGVRPDHESSGRAYLETETNLRAVGSHMITCVF